MPQAALNTDPTRTAVTRAAFARNLNQRFRLVLGAVRGFLITQDELGLGDRPAVLMNARRFAHLPDDVRLAEFKRFLAEQVQTHVLAETTPGNFWANLYAETAYKSAVNRGFRELRKDLLAGEPTIFTASQQLFARQTLRNPDAVARLKSIHTQLKDDLKSAAAQMDAAATRVMSEALAKGVKPKTAATMVNSAVVELGRKKALMAAHNAVVRGAADGILDAFELGGVSEVGLVAEWVYRRGACPRCVGKARKGPYKIAKARGLIPFHPWCRCFWRIVAAPPKRKRG